MELKDYARIVRKRWLTVLLVGALVTGATVGFSVLQPRTYQSQAQLLISQERAGAALLGLNTGDQSGLQPSDLATQLQLITTVPMAQSVIDRLGLKTTPDDLLKQVSVNSVGQTNVITIAATAGSPMLAARIANGFVESFIEQSRDSRRRSIEAAAKQVDLRLADAKQQIATLQAAAASGRSSTAQAELDTAKTLYGSLADKLQQLRVAEALETGSASVVSSATADPAPVSPDPVRNGLIGLAVGLALGVGCAFLADALDTTPPAAEELAAIYAVPVLAHIPREKLRKADRGRLAMLSRPASRAAEGFRELGHNLRFINFESKLQTLVITSAEPGEGKSTVAANLATALSQMGASVVLIVCDLRKPMATQVFELGGGVGLTDVLLGKSRASQALAKPKGAGMDKLDLRVIPPGPSPSNPGDLLGSGRMGTLIAQLRESTQWIIIDTPPVLAVADTAAVVQFADGVLVTVRRGVSTLDAARLG